VLRLGVRLGVRLGLLPVKSPAFKKEAGDGGFDPKTNGAALADKRVPAPPLLFSELALELGLDLIGGGDWPRMG
jgi:hypothetical protein